MPTLQEQLDENKARLNALLAPASTEPAEKMDASAVLAAVADELKKGNVSKERAAYLESVVADVAKFHFEQTSFTPLKFLNDPDQIKPQTASVGASTIQALVTASPQTHFASNATTAIKAAVLIHKLLVNPELIQKGQYSDKLEDLMDFFGLKKEDLKEEYDLRWKVGDLVCALQQAAKLEQFVSKAAKEAEEKAPGAPEKAVEKAAAPSGGVLPEMVWPSDMAKAKFDPVAKGYKREELPFGADSETTR